MTGKEALERIVENVFSNKWTKRKLEKVVLKELEILEILKKYMFAKTETNIVENNGKTFNEIINHIFFNGKEIDIDFLQDEIKVKEWLEL